MKVSLISDTHSYMDERIIHHLGESDLIIHAGDVGDSKVLDAIEEIAPTRCVYGNIDGKNIRSRCPEWEIIDLMGHKTLVIHIAGSVERYNDSTRKLVATHQPDSIICGHSHLLKVMADKKFNLLHLNPGAAGRHGFHKMRTILKFEVEYANLRNLQVIELGPRSSQSVS